MVLRGENGTKRDGRKSSAGRKDSIDLAHCVEILHAASPDSYPGSVLAIVRALRVEQHRACSHYVCECERVAWGANQGARF